MRNINLIKDLVYTKYGDFKGYISIDQMEDDVYQMCEDHGINMDKYLILSFGLTDETILGVGSHPSISCTVLLLEKERYGNSFEEIASAIKSLDNVDVIRKTFFIEYADLQKYIKRFSFSAVTEISDSIKKINIIEQ